MAVKRIFKGTFSEIILKVYVKIYSCRIRLNAVEVGLFVVGSESAQFNLVD